MQKFNLTIFRETRLYIGFAFLPVGLLGSVFLAAELGSFVWFILFFAAFLLLLYYFLIGHLTVTASDDELQFKWTKKLLFNYNDIEPVKYNTIKTLIIDNGQFLRKIITSDRTVAINTSKVKPKDASKLINRLSLIAKEHNIKTIDSWEVWAEKGYLKIAYRINTIILIGAGIIIIIAVAKGVFSRHFFWVLFLLPQQLFFGQQMKQKLKK